MLFGLSQYWEPLLHVIQHPSSVMSVAFSPDGSHLASGSDKIVQIRNMATGELEAGRSYRADSMVCGLLTQWSLHCVWVER